MEDLTNEEIEIYYNEFLEGSQNRFRNNDFRSFEQWLNDVLENES